MKSEPDPPFRIGDKVSWERDNGERVIGIIYAVDWMKTDGGFWRISATLNGKPYHPVSNAGPYRAASAKFFDPAGETRRMVKQKR